MQLNRFVAGNFSRDTNRDYFTLLEKYYEEEEEEEEEEERKREGCFGTPRGTT